MLLRSENDPPIYRFQAVQDADQAALWGEYDRALTLYQDAIFSNILLGWSPELYEQQAYSFLFDSTPTPFLFQSRNTTTWQHMPAFASWCCMRSMVMIRMVKLYMIRLVEHFPGGNLGMPFVVLAQGFWPAYLATHDVGQACSQALDAIGDEAGDILYWLDGDFHGRQAPDYQLVDLCPFGQVK